MHDHLRISMVAKTAVLYRNCPERKYMTIRRQDNATRKPKLNGIFVEITPTPLFQRI